MPDQQRLGVRDLTPAAFAMVAWVVMAASCDDGRSPTSPSTDLRYNGPVTVVGPQPPEGRIDGNHFHAAVLSLEQIQQRAAAQLDIQASADHSHTLNLDMEDVAVLDSGGGVVKRSSQNAGHDHVVTFPGAWDY